MTVLMGNDMTSYVSITQLVLCTVHTTRRFVGSLSVCEVGRFLSRSRESLVCRNELDPTGNEWDVFPRCVFTAANAALHWMGRITRRTNESGAEEAG